MPVYSSTLSICTLGPSLQKMKLKFKQRTMNLINELFAHFTTPQKTAEDIQAIPQDNKIYVEDWSEDTGFFAVDMHHIWWPEEIECYRKEIFPWEFREYCEANYSFESYEEWWKGLLRGTQRIIVEDFVRANESMLRNELEDYYSKQTNGITKRAL